MRSELVTRRVRRLERKLARYDEAEVAEVGARVYETLTVSKALDPYEVALTVTEKVLKFREQGVHAPSAARARMRRMLTEELDPIGLAVAGGLYACMACELAPRLATVAFEPEAA